MCQASMRGGFLLFCSSKTTYSLYVWAFREVSEQKVPALTVEQHDPFASMEGRQLFLLRKRRFDLPVVLACVLCVKRRTSPAQGPPHCFLFSKLASRRGNYQ